MSFWNLLITSWIMYKTLHLIANLSSDNGWVHGKNCLTNELDTTCDSVIWGSSMEQLVNCQKVNSKMIIAIILKKDEQGYKLKKYFNILAGYILDQYLIMKNFKIFGLLIQNLYQQKNRFCIAYLHKTLK